MTFNDIVQQFIRPSTTAWELLPDLGDAIDFATPSGKIIQGATVTRIEEFCGEWNVYVEYTFIGFDNREHPMTGWVALSQVM